MPSQAFSKSVATGYQLTESVVVWRVVVLFAFISSNKLAAHCIDSLVRTRIKRNVKQPLELLLTTTSSRRLVKDG